MSSMRIPMPRGCVTIPWETRIKSRSGMSSMRIPMPRGCVTIPIKGSMNHGSVRIFIPANSISMVEWPMSVILIEDSASIPELFSDIWTPTLLPVPSPRKVFPMSVNMRLRQQRTIPASANLPAPAARHAGASYGCYGQASRSRAAPCASAPQDRERGRSTCAAPSLSFRGCR